MVDIQNVDTPASKAKTRYGKNPAMPKLGGVFARPGDPQRDSGVSETVSVRHATTDPETASPVVLRESLASPPAAPPTRSPKPERTSHNVLVGESPGLAAVPEILAGEPLSDGVAALLRRGARSRPTLRISAEIPAEVDAAFNVVCAETNATKIETLSAAIDRIASLDVRTLTKRMNSVYADVVAQAMTSGTSQQPSTYRVTSEARGAIDRMVEDLRGAGFTRASARLVLLLAFAEAISPAAPTC